MKDGTIVVHLPSGRTGSISWTGRLGNIDIAEVQWDNGDEVQTVMLDDLMTARQAVETIMAL